MLYAVLCDLRAPLIGKLVINNGLANKENNNNKP